MAWYHQPWIGTARRELWPQDLQPIRMAGWQRWWHREIACEQLLVAQVWKGYWFHRRLWAEAVSRMLRLYWVAFSLLVAPHCLNPYQCQTPHASSFLSLYVLPLLLSLPLRMHLDMVYFLQEYVQSLSLQLWEPHQHLLCRQFHKESGLVITKIYNAYHPLPTSLMTALDS